MYRVIDMIKIVHILGLALVGSTSLATIGIAHAQSWYNTQTDSAIDLLVENKR
jgi:hypothetical protein